MTSIESVKSGVSVCVSYAMCPIRIVSGNIDFWSSVYHHVGVDTCTRTYAYTHTTIFIYSHMRKMWGTTNESTLFEWTVAETIWHTKSRMDNVYGKFYAPCDNDM